MPKYSYYQDARIITWERTHFTVDADSQEEADRIAKQQTNYDIADEQDGISIVNTATDCNANQLIPPAQNGGQPTIKVYWDDEDELLATNKF